MRRIKVAVTGNAVGGQRLFPTSSARTHFCTNVFILMPGKTGFFIEGSLTMFITIHWLLKTGVKWRTSNCDHGNTWLVTAILIVISLSFQVLGDKSVALSQGIFSRVPHTLRFVDGFLRLVYTKNPGLRSILTNNCIHCFQLCSMDSFSRLLETEDSYALNTGAAETQDLFSFVRKLRPNKLSVWAQENIFYVYDNILGRLRQEQRNLLSSKLFILTILSKTVHR